MLSENTKKSKSEIYAEYGITFQNGKILAPNFGLIAPLLVDGNEKIGKGVFHFSTLPTNKTFAVDINGVVYNVQGTCPCHCVGCYATKGNYNFKGVRLALAIRTILARFNQDFVKNAILAQIKAENVKAVRIHASGDFFSDSYVEMWKSIISECPDTNFWTYTKKTDAENAFDSFPNANIVRSIVPNCGLNFGHCDYILSTYETLKANGETPYICRCGIDKNQHCADCKGCSINRYVLFIEHSTDYKAEKDPLFNSAKAIIESQKRPE